MKLPKLPYQWTKLDDQERENIDDAHELVTEFLVHAGYKSPQDLDDNHDEIGDSVQALLMDAALRAPKLWAHIEACNRASMAAVARERFVEWASKALLTELSGQLAASTKALNSPGGGGSAADEIRIVKAEIARRGGVETEHDAITAAAPEQGSQWGPWGPEGRQGN